MKLRQTATAVIIAALLGVTALAFAYEADIKIDGGTRTFTGSQDITTIEIKGGASVDFIGPTSIDGHVRVSGYATKVSFDGNTNIRLSKIMSDSNMAPALRAGAGGDGGIIEVNKGKTEGITNIYCDPENVAVGKTDGLAHAEGVRANGSSADITIGGKELNITLAVKEASKDEGYLYGIYANTNTATSPIPNTGAKVKVTATNTNIKIYNCELGNFGLNAVSNGRIDINSNLYVLAKNVICTRGYSNVNINTDGARTTQFYGDINFDYHAASSGTAINSYADVNLSGDTSIWQGNSYASWSGMQDSSHDVAFEDGGLLKVDHLYVTLANGAKWVPTYIASEDTSSDSKWTGQQQIKVNTLTMDGGVIAFDTTASVSGNNIAKAAIGMLSGDKGTINMFEGAETSVQSFDIKELTVNGGTLKIGSTINSGTVTFAEGVTVYNASGDYFGNNVTATINDGVVFYFTSADKKEAFAKAYLDGRTFVEAGDNYYRVTTNPTPAPSPAAPVVSDDTKVVLAEKDVVVAEGVITATEQEAHYLLSADFDSDAIKSDASGAAIIAPAAAVEMLKEQGITTEEDAIVPMQIAATSADTNAKGKIVMLSFTISGDAFGDVVKTPSQLCVYNAMKCKDSTEVSSAGFFSFITADTTTKVGQFSYISDFSQAANKKFTLLDMDGNIVTGNIEKGKTYQLSVFIQDNDDEGFDLDRDTNGSVTSAVFVDTSRANSTGGSSSSGGCNAGFAALALAGLAVAALKKRK